MFPFKDKAPQEDVSLKEQGAAAVKSAGKALSCAAGHLSTLLELFCLETGEWSARLVRKAVLLVAGLVLALFGYAMLLVLAAYLLAGGIGWGWALFVLGVPHLSAGVILIMAAVRRKVGHPAPDTVQEIKNDVQCIRILLQEENKSC